MLVSRRTLLAGLAFAVLIVGGLWLARSGKPGEGRELPAPAIEARPESEESDAGKSRASGPRSPEVRRPVASRKEEVGRLLDKALDVLRRGDPAEIEAMIREMDRVMEVGGGQREETIAAIVAFLQGGADAPTGMDFVVGEGGGLSESTTLRVYLMDKLGILSREAGSAEALEIGRDTLSGFGSADEWAVAMRNIAWLDAGSRDFLAEKVIAMQGHQPWLEEPGAGMLEAFDVIVHTRALEAVPNLAQMLGMEESPLSRASAVTLNRLASEDSARFVPLLNEHPAYLSEMPLERAGLVAFADLANAEQRAAVEDYLTRPDVGAAEREHFLGSLIQNGQFVSDNLITPLVPPETGEDAVKRLENVAGAVDAWMGDPRFSAFRDKLAALGATIDSILGEIEADTGGE